MSATIAAATPATAKAPAGPAATIASSRSGSMPSSSSCAWGSLMVFSLGKGLAQVVGLRGKDGRAGVVPGDADISHAGRHFVVVKQVGEGRHAVGARILGRPGRVAAVEHHAD